MPIKNPNDPTDEQAPEWDGPAESGPTDPSPSAPGPTNPNGGIAGGGVTPPAAPPANPRQWIDDALNAVKSTDSRDYWYKAIGDRNDIENASARDYWIDRINRGDGSELVRTGKLQKFQDGPSSGPGSSAYQDQVRQILMGILGQAQQPVNENSAEIQQPFQAAALDAQRGQDLERKQLAERLYAEGGGGTNELTQGTQQSAERLAGTLGNIKSQLIGRAVQNKQAQLQQALALAVQSGDAEAARAIQAQILAFQQSQWNDNYGLQLSDRQYQRDRDAARAKAGLPF